MAIGMSSPAPAAKVVRTKVFFGLILTISGGRSFEALVNGSVEAAKPKCLHGRKAILYFKRGRHKRHLRDVDHSSRHGALGLDGRSRSMPERLVIRVTKKRVENHGDPYVCWPTHRSFNLRRSLKRADGTVGPHHAVKHRIEFPLPR
jgi:hypothetical protein